MKAAVCLIESNRRPGNTADLVRAAHARGLQVLVATSDPASLSAVRLPGVEAVVADTQSAPALAEALLSLRHVRVTGVTTAHDFFTPIAAQTAALLGLPGPDPEAVWQCRRKDRQRQALARSGVSQPDFRVCHGVAEAVEAGIALGLPVIVKPVALAESIGVELCRTAEEVAAHASALLESDRFATRRPVPGNPVDRILIESFAVGREFAVEVFDGRFVGVTETDFCSPPGFVEYEHTLFPAGTPAFTDALADCALRACEALSLGHGPVHVEMRWVDGVPRIIEVNPRLAGGQIPALFHRSAGLDLWDATVCACTGLADSPLPSRPRDDAAIVRYMRLSRDAVVDVGASLADTIPMSAQDYSIELMGDGPVSARRPTRGSDMVGWVVAGGPTAGECAATLDDLWLSLGERLPELSLAELGSAGSRK